MTLSTHSNGTTDTASRTGRTVPPLDGLPFVEEASKVTTKDARALSKVFFDRLRSLEEGSAEHSYVRGTLIEMNMTLIRYCARRFRGRGVAEQEDILQVGTIGLIKAIDRFDLSREVEFTTFAIPYIVGEMKRHFRDTTWAVHVPRRLQELRVELAKAREYMTAILGAPPTVAELAAYLELTEDEVVDGLVAANGYTAGSIDLPADGEEGGGEATGRSYAETMGAPDPAMDLVEDFQTLAPILATLGERERLILQLRFGQEMTQSEIGAELGYSQMHISRLLSQTLGRLRRGLLAES